MVWYSKGLAICDASKEPEFTATLLTNRAECNRQLCEIKAVVGGVLTHSQPPGVSVVFFNFFILTLGSPLGSHLVAA